MDLQVEKNLSISRIKNELYSQPGEANHSQGAEASPGQVNSAISPELQQIIGQLKSLTPEQQQQILKLWSSLNLPLNINIMNRLTELLQQPPELLTDIGSGQLIKSFAFLLEQRLPLSPLFVESLIQAQQPLPTSPMGTETDNLLKFPEDLSLDLEQSPDQIKQRLSNFPELMEKTLLNLHQSENSDQKSPLFKKLLGEQLINLRQPGDPLLLTLELPVILPEQPQPEPLYLKIEKFTANNKDQAKSDDGLKISFIIELPKLGPLRADIILHNKKIRSQFWTDNRETSRLIAREFIKLKEKLEKEGFTVQKPGIKEFTGEQSPAAQIREFRESRLISREINSNYSTGYHHIDFQA